MLCAFLRHDRHVGSPDHIFARLSRSIRIQADRPGTDKSLHILLRFKPNDLQIADAGDDSQNHLSKGDVVPEDAAHKIIVDRTQTTESR